MYTYVYTYIYIFVCMCVNVYICSYIYIYTYSYIYIYIYIYTSLFIYKCMCVSVRVCACLCVYIYVHASNHRCKHPHKTVVLTVFAGVFCGSLLRVSSMCLFLAGGSGGVVGSNAGRQCWMRLFYCAQHTLDTALIYRSERHLHTYVCIYIYIYICQCWCIDRSDTFIWTCMQWCRETMLHAAPLLHI